MTWPAACTPCPRCGAPVGMDAGDPVLLCGYCRTRLYLWSPEPLAYHFPLHADPPRALVWVPYWRFRGLRYRVGGQEGSPEGGLLDASVPAREGLLEDTSLGIRPQVAPLALGSPGPGRRARPDRPPAEAMARAEVRVDAALGGGPSLTRVIGETVALLLAPHCLEREAAGWALRSLLPDGGRHRLEPGQARGLRRALEEPWKPRPPRAVPLRCPECAAGLPAVAQACAFWCPRCGRGWWPRGGRLAPLDFRVVPAHDRAGRHLPFWELVFRADGLPFRTRADLVRWAVPYWRPDPAWEDEAPRVRVPAFKTNPGLFLRVARNLSLAGGGGRARARLPGPCPEVEPVRLPLSEAAQALKPVLAEMVRTRPRDVEAVVRCRVRVRAARLVLLAFRARGGEWVEETAGAAVPAAALERGRLI